MSLPLSRPNAPSAGPTFEQGLPGAECSFPPNPAGFFSEGSGRRPRRKSRFRVSDAADRAALGSEDRPCYQSAPSRTIRYDGPGWFGASPSARMRSNPLLSIPGGVGFRVSWHPRHACYLPVSRELTRGPKMATTGARTTGRERDPFFPLPLPRCLTRCLHRDYFPYSIPCPMGKRWGWVL